MVEGKDPFGEDAEQNDRRHVILCVLLIVAIILAAGLTILIFAISRTTPKYYYEKIVPDQPLSPTTTIQISGDVTISWDMP